MPEALEMCSVKQTVVELLATTQTENRRAPSNHCFTSALLYVASALTTTLKQNRSKGEQRAQWFRGKTNIQAQNQMKAWWKYLKVLQYFHSTH